MDTDQAGSERARPRAVTSWARWLVAGGLLGLAAACHLGRLGYWLDLCANVAFQVALVSAATGAVFLARRRLRAAAVLLTAAVIATSALPLARVLRASPGARANVRVLSLNTRTTNPRVDAIVSLIVASEADVVVLIEPSGDLVRALRDDRSVRDTYPSIRMPQRGDPYHLTLSRWPVVGGASAWRPFHRGRGAVMQTPHGPFAFIQIHPRSPRGRAEWRDGNRTVREAIGLARAEFDGLPTLIAGDLNSAPSGSRSRELSRSGFARSKPFFRACGTFPAWLFWPMRLPIDDVCASPDWRLVSWKAVTIPGSDHLGVSVALSLDSDAEGSDSSGAGSGGRTPP